MSEVSSALWRAHEDLSTTSGNEVMTTFEKEATQTDWMGDFSPRLSSAESAQETTSHGRG